MPETNKIICGDCLEVMKDWPDNCVDLVLTDPPYEYLTKGNNITGGGFMKQQNKKHLEAIRDTFGIRYSPTEYLAFCKRICRPFNGYFFTNKTLLVSYIKFAEMNNYKWEIIIWSKPNPIPLNNFHYLMDKEYIVFIKERGAYFNSHLGYQRYFTVKSYPIGTKNTQHPTEKPIVIMLDLVEISTKYNNIIFDGYVGSGTFCIAAKMLGRRYIGIDISEKYCQIARQRLEAVDTGVPVREQNKGQLALFGMSNERNKINTK